VLNEFGFLLLSWVITFIHLISLLWCSIFEVWCTLISFHTGKLLLRNNIWALWPELWVTTTVGFCITIMHRLTPHSFFVTDSPSFLLFGFVWPLAIPKTQDYSGEGVLSRFRILKKSKMALMAVPERDYLACFEDCKGKRFRRYEIDLKE